MGLRKVRKRLVAFGFLMYYYIRMRKKRIQPSAGIGKMTGIAILFVLAFIVGGYIINVGNEAFAGGAVIGTGTTPSGDGDSGSSPCTSTANHVECKGVSWIYYAATGLKTTDMMFPTSYDNPAAITIPSECSVAGRGFWHFGRNAIAINGDHGDGYFSNYNRLRDYDGGNGWPDGKSYKARYNSTRGAYGHMKTYNWGFNNYSATKYMFGGTLHHDLYHSDTGARYTFTKVYSASRYGTIGEVFEHFKKAWRYAYGSDYSGTTFPSNLQFFCYWDGMAVPATLTAVHINFDNPGQIIMDKVADQKLVGETASVTRRDAPTGWTFLGWCDSQSNCPNKISGPTWSETLSGDKVVYAVYGELKTLTGTPIDAETGDDISSIISATSSTVLKYESASITRPNPATDWKFLGWCDTKTDWNSCGSKTYGDTYSVSTLSEHKTVYPVYVKKSFQGKLIMDSDSTDGVIDWTQNDGDKAITIDCYNYSTGCGISFEMRLRRTKGSGKTKHFHYRNDALAKDITDVDPPNTTDGIQVGLYQETIYPGQTLCYTLVFYPYGYYANDLSSLKACVTADVSTFQGRSIVSGATSGDTGLQSTNKVTVAFVDKCSPTTGCDVYFEHKMKRTHGIGWTDYNVRRDSNLTDVNSPRKIDTVSRVASGDSFNSDTEIRVSYTGPFKLYPGMVLCESLRFQVNNRYSNYMNSSNYATTQVCASALGNAQPNDPVDPNDPDVPSSDPNGDTGSDAFIDIEVKNNDVSRYNTYRRIVYAKPTDKLTYRARYNPNVQYTYYLKPQLMQIDSGTKYPRSGTNSSLSLATMFNTYRTPGWNNDIIVYSSHSVIDNSKELNYNYDGVYAMTHNYRNGSMAKHEETNDHSVLKGEVGRSLNENADINYSGNNSIKTTPGQVLFMPNGTRNLANVLTSRRYRVAYARVPYNYGTAVEITDHAAPDSTDPSDPTSPDSGPDIAYAGEDREVNFKVDITPKYNSETMNPGDEPYATKTGPTSLKLIVYVSETSKGGTARWGNGRDADLCNYYGMVRDSAGTSWNCGYYNARSKSNENYTETLNPNGVMTGWSNNYSTTFYAPDLKAGTKICSAIAIYPSDSSSDDTNMDSEGSRQWRISDSKCYVIAKRPNLQVSGGGMYSAGKVNVSVSTKRNVYGYYPVTLSSTANTTVFGSWVEQNVLSAGLMQGLASGASTGYFGSTNNKVPESNRTPKAGLGGSYEGGSTTYCIRVPLTIPNTGSSIPCRTLDRVGSEVIDKTIADPEDKEKLVARFMQNTDESGLQYEKISGDYIVEGLTIPKGLTYVIHATGDITIANNIDYEDGYSSLDQIPKLIIYAEKNITISCGVSRISAVLIAGKNSNSDGVVDTCPTTYTSYNYDPRAVMNWRTIKNKVVTASVVNVPNNSNQLKITGTVIANKLVANRTYGAGKGADSVIPAEIIDYDTTLYGWGARESEGSVSGRMQTVYTHELAPRY